MRNFTEKKKFEKCLPCMYVSLSTFLACVRKSFIVKNKLTELENKLIPSRLLPSHRAQEPGALSPGVS